MVVLYRYGLLIILIGSIVTFLGGCSQATATEPDVEARQRAPTMVTPSLLPTVTLNPTQLIGSTRDAEKQEFFDSLYRDQEPPES